MKRLIFTLGIICIIACNLHAQTNTFPTTYYLPVNNGNVYINFYNNSGALLKSVKLNGTGNGSIIMNARDLSSGYYHYTLLVNGKIIDASKWNSLNKKIEL